jgi:hypothetical protein
MLILNTIEGTDGTSVYQWVVRGPLTDRESGAGWM